jgi:magnesium chelatase subunit I
VGELEASGYRNRPIKQEIRENLRRKLADGETLFPDVIGYDRTVIPELVNALLAGHDLILLGLRGQAKTRILRQLTGLLDEQLPVLAGCELNDDPFAPVTTTGRALVEELGSEAPIEWMDRHQRYNEKLATPDVSIADLLGDIDPIKAATHKLTFADPEVIHFGIVPRTNRGIFAINEVPDLAPRIQVGLLNILEERDLQIRGFPIRIPLDILMVFSANPEDYTNRGTIITPLKDRLSSQILTHYPTEIGEGTRITQQEARIDRGEDNFELNPLAWELVEQVAFSARESDLVDHTSGVSARLPIAAMELLASNLERRALRTPGDRVTPRICDLHMILPAITGKVEMVYEGEQKGVEVVARQLIGQAVREIFERRFPEIGRELGSGGEDDDGPYANIVRWFADGNVLELSDEQTNAEYESALSGVPELMELARSLTPAGEAEPPMVAELILEGLAQHSKLGREDLDSTVTYKEMLKFQLLRARSEAPSGYDEFT